MSTRLLDYAAPVLRAAREGAGLSQVQIAERAGVSHATISRLETSQTWPGGRNVEAVIDAYVTAIGLTQLEVLERIVENWRRDERGGVKSAPARLPRPPSGPAPERTSAG